MVGMFNSALRTERGADNANRIGAVALNFEVKTERRSLNGYQISIYIDESRKISQNVWLHMKYKKPVNQVLMDFRREIEK